MAAPTPAVPEISGMATLTQNFKFWSNRTPFSIFVDPNMYLGFVGDSQNYRLNPNTYDPDDPDGSLVKPYIDRLQNVCSFYTYLADYGDVNNPNGSYPTGWTGFVEAHARIPPERRRNIMLNIQEYWTLEAMYSPNFYSTGVSDGGIAGGLTFGYGRDFPYYDTENASGITYPAIPESWKTDPQIISEFARQNVMGVPYLAGGITPSTPGITMGVFKAVAKRFWNDQAAYVKSRGTENVIQYSDFGTPQIAFSVVPKIGLRSVNATGDRSWWRRDFYYPNLYDDINYSKEKGILRDLADGSLSADMYGGSVYNWFPNIGEDISYAWKTTRDRLLYVSPGVSSVALTDYDLDDLSYWASKGPAALMHEYYNYTDELAENTSNPAYRKGLAMIVQLDSPVIPAANKIGGGEYAATKFGYMKDLGLAADIDIFGAFGATDANVSNMRKPDQIWVWSSNWYNTKLLFESGTGNAADVSLFGWDELTARFGVYTARSQVEKLLFKRPMMTEDEAILLGESDGYFLNPTPEQQIQRLQWLEENTLPNVYWDARIGLQYTEGTSNNVRFWSATTGNCLPAPCVLDRTSPIAAYLNMNNDIYKNDVRVAYKKWISETHTSAIERVHSKLSAIGFAPKVQKKKPTLFVDPNTEIGWIWYEAGFYDPDVAEFRNRMLKAATPYTYVASRLAVFGPLDETYLPQQRYFDATYGLSSNIEIQIDNGQTNPLLQLLPDGQQCGYYLPPISSRAVMFNSERPWLGLLAAKAKDDFGSGNIDQNDPEVIAEFARQALMGPSVAPYLFPEGHPEGGLTPGSSQTTLGVVRRVGEKQWNDLSEYALGNKDGSYSSTPKARYVIHYAGAPSDSNFGVARSGIRRSPNTTTRSYWERNSILSDYNDIYDGGETSIDRTKSLYNCQKEASALGMPYYNTFPSSKDWAIGATFWFTDFSLGNRKSPTGQSLASDYSFADTLYWQTKEHSSIIGNFDLALARYELIDEKNPPKIDAIVTPVWSYEGGEITETLWNAWSGGRKDPKLAARMDAASLFAPRDPSNLVMKSPDSIWVWDAAYYYWINIPTKQTYDLPESPLTEWPDDDVISHTLFARNQLEKVLFGRPNYPIELLQQIESDGISSGGIEGVSVNNARIDIQARTGKWIFDNSLTDGWWAVAGPGSENRIWYDPQIKILIEAQQERFEGNDFAIGATAYYSNSSIPTQQNAIAIGKVVDWAVDDENPSIGQLDLSFWTLGYPNDVRPLGNIVVTGSNYTLPVTVNSIIVPSSKLPSPCVLDQNSPLAPWLDFTGTINRENVIEAMRYYISDHNCQYVEEFRRVIDRIYD